MDDGRLKMLTHLPAASDFSLTAAVAHFDGEEEAGNYGYGATEAEAIADFIETWADEYEEADARRREREADARHNGGLSPLGNALAEELLRRDAELSRRNPIAEVA